MNNLDKTSIDALIFDMDGTLWDAVDSYCEVWNACFRKFGVERTVMRDELLKCMGLPIDVIYKNITGDNPQIAPTDYLPELEALTETLSGAGISGEIDDPAIGQFSAMSMDITFRLLDREAASMLDMRKAVKLTVRGAQQTLDTEGNTLFRSMRVVVRGKATKISLGTVKRAGTMDSSVSLSVTYLLIEVDGETLLELDKLNQVYKQFGQDMLAEVKEMC